MATQVENDDMSLALPPDKDRFLIELEFVQNLANMKYLNFLAQKRYFDDPAFMNFLKYLTYWKKPEYARHLLFPQCLAFLDELLENPAFRRELAVPQFIDYCHQIQGLHWMHENRS
jgi:mediator of RNA polymerase II transcription subunit 31